MAIKYTYYDYKCPHCGETYKTTFWDLYKVLIVLWTVGFALSWILAIAIMRAVFGSGDMPDVGDASCVCKNCGKRFMSYEHDEWNTLDKESKKKWSYRSYLRALYAIGGFVPILILFQFFWASEHDSDHTVALVSLIFAVLFIVIIVYGYYAWKKYEQNSEITLSQYDFNTVIQSLKRTGNDPKEENPPIRIRGTMTVYGIKSGATKVSPMIKSGNKTVVVGDESKVPDTSDYGYSKENPILLSSILEEYPYLSSLETSAKNKTITGIERKERISGDIGSGFLDMWEITLLDYNLQTEQIVKLYINPYSDKNNCFVCPHDFKFK